MSFFFEVLYWKDFILTDVIPLAVVIVGNCAIVFKIFASKRLRDVAAKDDKGSRKVEHFSHVHFYYIGHDNLLPYFITFGSTDPEGPRAKH